MVQDQLRLNKLLNRAPLYEMAKGFLAKSPAEAKEIWRVILSQVYYTFNQGLLLLFIIAVLVAVLVSMQAGFGLSVIGASSRIRGTLGMDSFSDIRTIICCYFNYWLVQVLLPQLKPQS